MLVQIYDVNGKNVTDIIEYKENSEDSEYPPLILSSEIVLKKLNLTEQDLKNKFNCRGTINVLFHDKISDENYVVFYHYIMDDEEYYSIVEPDNCPICQSFEYNDDNFHSIHILECEHIIHTKCLTEELKNCPVCQAPFKILRTVNRSKCAKIYIPLDCEVIVAKNKNTGLFCFLVNNSRIITGTNIISSKSEEFDQKMIETFNKEEDRYYKFKSKVNYKNKK